MRRRLGAASAGLLLIAGCSHRVQVASAPPPPAPTAREVSPKTAGDQGILGDKPQGTRSEQAIARADRPIYSEVGLASWYGPNYHTHRAANGEVYDQNGISAAHRTLPMGSLIRVTNLQTGQSAMMHITDRGPFVPDRVIDLSEGAAKDIGVWRSGTTRVRIDVYEAPKPIESGGRWCVQIGAFEHGRDSRKLEEHLQREYAAANVIEFTGPTGHWVRIRPQNGDKRLAIEIVRNMRLKEGAAYLVRMD
jgi:rare lipoprotein A